MKTLRSFSILILFCLLAACGGGGGGEAGPGGGATDVPTAAPTPSGPQARVVDVINQVDAHPTAEAEWAPAVVDAVIYLGGEVRAMEASTARLRIEDTLVRVAPNTIFSFKQPSDGTLQIDLQEGQIWLNVEGLQPGQQFEVQTPSAVASVRGTIFSVRVDENDITHLSVARGFVDLTGAGVTLPVSEGYEAKVRPGEAPMGPFEIGLPEALRWGMAVGDALDMVLPAYGEPVFIQQAGYVTSDGLPALSPDGRWLFYHIYDPTSGQDSVNMLWNMEEKVPALLDVPSGVYRITFNPVDGRIAYTDRGQVCVSQLDGTDKTCMTDGATAYSNATWMPDGMNLVAIGNNGSNATLYYVQPGGVNSPIPFESSRFKYNPAWSPDGRNLAYVSAKDASSNAPGELWVGSLDGSVNLPVFTDIPRAYSASYAWMPDGSLFVAGTDGVGLVSADGTSAQSLGTPMPGSYNGLAASPSATGYPIFYRFKELDPDAAFHRYMLTAPEIPPYRMPDWYYGPIWASLGNYLVVGTTVKDPNNSQSAPITTFYRFSTSPDFLP